MGRMSLLVYLASMISLLSIAKEVLVLVAIVRSLTKTWSLIFLTALCWLGIARTGTFFWWPNDVHPMHLKCDLVWE